MYLNENKNPRNDGRYGRGGQGQNPKLKSQNRTQNQAAQNPGNLITNLNLNHLNLTQIMQMGMQAIPSPITLPAASVWNTFVACSRFWILFYAIWLLFLDMFFTIFPTTLVVITVLTLGLHYTKIPTPPTQFLNAVFGVDPNVIAQTQAQPRSHTHGNNNFNFDFSSIFGGQNNLQNQNQNRNQNHHNNGANDIARAILGTALNGALPLPLVLGAANPNIAGMALSLLKNTLDQNLHNNQNQNRRQDVAFGQFGGQGQGQAKDPPNPKLRTINYKPDSSGNNSNRSSNASSVDNDGGYRTPTPDQLLEQGLTASLKAQLSSSMPPLPVPVIARRGAGMDVPENTLKAIDYCKEKNCHFVHFDVRLTRDNIAVVFHDRDLFRMAGIDRKVRYISSQEIRNIDVSFLHPLGAKYRGAMVPTFDQAIENCIKQNIKFFFNVKGSSSQMVEVVLQAYQTYKAMYSMAVMTSFDWGIIHKIRRRDSKIIACLATPYAHRNKACHSLEPGFINESLQNQASRGNGGGGIAVMEWYHQLSNNFQDWLLDSFLWWYLGICAVLIEKESASKNNIHEWGTRGIHTFLWSVNSSVEKLYLNQVLKVGYLTDTIADDPVLHPHLDPTIPTATTTTAAAAAAGSAKTNNAAVDVNQQKNRQTGNQNIFHDAHDDHDDTNDYDLMSVPLSPQEPQPTEADSLKLIQTLNYAAAKLEEQRKRQRQVDAPVPVPGREPNSSTLPRKR